MTTVKPHLLNILSCLMAVLLSKIALSDPHFIYLHLSIFLNRVWETSVESIISIKLFIMTGTEFSQLVIQFFINLFQVADPRFTGTNKLKANIQIDSADDQHTTTHINAVGFGAIGSGVPTNVQSSVAMGLAVSVPLTSVPGSNALQAGFNMFGFSMFSGLHATLPKIRRKPRPPSPQELAIENQDQNISDKVSFDPPTVRHRRHFPVTTDRRHSGERAVSRFSLLTDSSGEETKGIPNQVQNRVDLGK